MNREDNKSTTFFKFEDLRVYNKAIGFVSLISESASMSASEIEQHYYMRFLDEATNISLQIAEGSSKNKNTFIEQLKQAKASIRKCVVFATIGKENHFITQEKESVIRTQLMELTKMIGALIISLQKNSDNNGHHHTTDLHEDTDSENIPW